MKVTAERKANGEKPAGSVEVDFDMPPTLNDMVKSYGESIVYNHAKGSVIVALQGYLRTQLGKKPIPSQADIQKDTKAWKPGVRKQGKSPAEKAREQLAKLSPEERTALLKEHRASQPKATGAAA